MKMLLGGSKPIVDIQTGRIDPEFDYYKKVFANHPRLFEYFASTKSLTRQQLEVVLNCEENMLVVAGAGSGKTTTMVEKIAFLANYHGIRTDAILFLTFTDDASKTMKERLEARGVKGVVCGTFHSVFGRLLSEYLGENVISRLIKEEDQKTLVRRILKELKLAIEDKEFLTQISFWKNNLLDVSDIEDSHFLKDGYALYESEKRRIGVIDFDDIQTMIHNTLLDDEFFRYSIVNRYQYVFVDEYQDVNKAQVSILDLIMNDSTVHQVVGDPRQSIYGFRGSDPRFILEFSDKYRAVSKSLSINFRSTPSIVELSNNLASHNGVIGKERMSAFNSEFDLYPEYTMHESDEDEAVYIASKIHSLLELGANQNEITVLVRNGFFADCIVSELQNRSVSFRLSAKSNFSLFNRPSIRAFLGILKLFLDENDLKAIKQTQGLFYLSNVEYSKLEKMDFTVKSAMRRLADLQYRFSNQNVIDFLIAFDSSASMSKPVSRLKHIYVQCFRSQWSGRPDMATYISDLEMFFSIIENYNSPSEVFRHIEEYNNAITKAHKNTDGVLITTFHASKGQEWDIVFVTGLTDGLLPSKQNINLVEERNVAYVGVTRARKMAYLTSPVNHPYSDTMEVSGFVSEMSMKGFVGKRKSMFV